MTLKVTENNIVEVLKEKEITVLDFSADWCGPCKMLTTIIESLSSVNTDITIGKVNVDENSNLSSKYSVRGIPTLIFFKDGKEIDRIVGVTNKGGIQTKIDALK